MSRTLRIVTLTAIFAATGCGTAPVRFTSLPPGAAIKLDGVQVGNTPFTVEIPRREIPKDHQYRVELDGFRPVEGWLRPRIYPGRMVAAVLTLGISRPFRPPRGFQDIFVEMAPLSADGASGTATVEQRLHRLDDLHQRGLISNEEYELARREILRGL
jgi:hypothetical protein